MRVVKIVMALGPIDARNMMRDPMLRWILLYPLFIALLIRLGIPLLADYLLAEFQFNVAPYYPLLMSFLVVMMPILVGTVIGFVLLDQRDDQTLTALQVTPLTLNGYLIYRISTPLLLSVLVTFAVFIFASLIRVRFLDLFLVAVSAAPLAPIYALTLAAFSANKVQGFALTKALGVLLVPPVLAYFIPSPWYWICGLVPLFWPVKTFWLIHEGQPYWIVMAAGMVYQSLLVLGLVHRFNRSSGV